MVGVLLCCHERRGSIAVGVVTGCRGFRSGDRLENVDVIHVNTTVVAEKLLSHI